MYAFKKKKLNVNREYRLTVLRYLEHSFVTIIGLLFLKTNHV